MTGFNLSFAEDTHLTLDKAINIALENNPELKAERAKLGVSRAEVKTANTLPNPKLVSDNGFAENTYRAGIEQLIELGGKRHKRVAVANAQKSLVKSKIEQAIFQLKNTVRKAYTDLYLTQEREQALREILENTQRLFDISKKRELAGDISQLDTLQADIALLNTNNELLTLSSEIIKSKNNLNTLLGEPLSNTISLEAPPVDPFVSLTNVSPNTEADLVLIQLTEKALAQRAEIHHIAQQKEVLSTQLSLIKASNIPDLSLTAGPDIISGGGNQSKLNAFFIANINLPILNRQKGAIESIAEQKIVLGHEEEALKAAITLGVNNAYKTFQAQQERVTRYNAELIPKAHLVLEKSRRSFEEGKSSILIPLNAQQSYINTKLGAIQAMVDLQNAITDLERTIGQAP